MFYHVNVRTFLSKSVVNKVNVLFTSKNIHFTIPRIPLKTSVSFPNTAWDAATIRHVRFRPASCGGILKIYKFFLTYLQPKDVLTSQNYSQIFTHQLSLYNNDRAYVYAIKTNIQSKLKENIATNLLTNVYFSDITIT